MIIQKETWKQNIRSKNIKTYFLIEGEKYVFFQNLKSCFAIRVDRPRNGNGRWASGSIRIF